MAAEQVLAVKVSGKCTGYFETSHPVGKYMLKCLTNTVMVSPGQSKDYQSQIISYKPRISVANVIN